jgi:hypothetical protein
MVTRQELEALRDRDPDLPWPLCPPVPANSGPAHDLHRPALPRRVSTRDRDRGAGADRSAGGGARADRAWKPPRRVSWRDAMAAGQGARRP